MADDLTATLFTEARAHHEATRRWFFTVTAALAIFYVLIFRPYVDLTGKKTEAAGALAHNTSLKQELDGIGPEFAHLSALTTDEAKQRLDGLLVDLRSVFGRLNNVVANLHSMGPEQASGKAGEELFTAEGRSSMAVQMHAPIMNAMGTPLETHLPVMNEPLRRDIAGASSERSVLDLIKPYVEREVIAPRFLSFNEDWRKDVAPEVASAANTLLQRVRNAGSRFPDEAASWTSLEQAVSSVANAAGKFDIEPPPQPFWWADTASKGEAVRDFIRILDESALSHAPAFNELKERVDAAIAANGNRQEQIDGLIAQLNEEFREQQKELAALVEPLKGISVDLATVVPYFPIIVGVSFVTLTALLVSRTRELGGAVGLIARGTPESPAREWLRSRVTASPWYGLAWIVARCVVVSIWVSLASWELASVSLLSRAQAILFGLAGAMSMTLASLYEWRAVRSLRGVIGS